MGRVIDTKTWRLIELIILKYPESVKKLKEYEEDIILSTGSSDNGKTNFDTDYVKPQSATEAKAFKLNNIYSARLKKQIKTIDAEMATLRPAEQDVIRQRYWTSKKKQPYLNIKAGYSERQMKRIVFRFIYRVGIELGEIEDEQ